MRLIYLCFSLRKDIFNYRDINCFLFFDNGFIILVIVEDFNIRNFNWDSSYHFHLVYSNLLLDIADLFDLKLSVSIQQVSTCYANNSNDANSVINLIFLCLNLSKIDNHQILSKLQYLSDYASLVVNISIEEEYM